MADLSVILYCFTEGEGAPPPKDGEKKDEKDKKSSDSITIHLVMPGVPAPVDVMVCAVLVCQGLLQLTV